MLPYITPDEAAELTYYGSEVIHPFTMEQVIRASIPIRIKNTFNPAGKGTVVAPPEHRDGDSEEEPAAKEVEQSGAAQPYFARLSGHATAVTIKSPVTVLNVHSNRKSVSHGFLAHIFRVLDRFVIVVDLISTSEVHVSMALGPNVNERSLELALGELRKTGTVDVLPNMAILSLVGEGMKNAVGISGRMFLALGAVGVNIEMISQGARWVGARLRPLTPRKLTPFPFPYSEINISCVIERNMANEALQAVHDTCVLGMPLKTREA